MEDSMTVLVALVALCVATTVLIWQVSTLTDKVHDMQVDMHATARWLARVAACRQKDGGDDEDQR